jgi:hypothetical protein
LDSSKHCSLQIPPPLRPPFMMIRLNLILLSGFLHFKI